MDVTGQSFFYHLPRILEGIATCCFVSLDLELSGIATNLGGPSAGGTQTLQERYAEIREAANRYQILQIGLTIGHEDPTTGKEKHSCLRTIRELNAPRDLYPETIQPPSEPHYRPAIGS